MTLSKGDTVRIVENAYDSDTTDDLGYLQGLLGRIVGVDHPPLLTPAWPIAYRVELLDAPMKYMLEENPWPFYADELEKVDG
jgi:hypothetical protein